VNQAVFDRCTWFLNQVQRGTLVFVSVSKQDETYLTLTFSIDIAQFIIKDSSAPSAEIEQWQIDIHDLTIA
jgi:hypothetical protein